MLLNTINLVKDESAAEANLILAQIFYNNGQNNQALETLYSLNENFQGYPYWVGKSYILIAEIFLSDDDKFQAEATLSSIIENTSVEEVKTEALSILKKINLDDEPL
jgi:predicted negative regulator of RcsB-dependent stress response